MDLKKNSWSQQDILDLVNNSTEESIHLDFKSAGSLDKTEIKKSEISKDVSAFANSDGGVIIYGILEDKHLAKEISFINGNIYTKEWLEQIINSNIQQKLPDVKIFPIRFDGDISRSVYVVDIPSSTNGPHISKDKRYYRRYNFESVIMEEYEIRNFYLRKQLSDVVLHGVFVFALEDQNWAKNQKYKFMVDVKVKNLSKTYSDSYKVSLALNKTKDININYEVEKLYNLSYLNKNQIALSTTKRIAIFPDEITTIINFTLEIDYCNRLNITYPIVVNVKVYNEGWVYNNDIKIDDLIKNIWDSFDKDNSNSI